MMQQVFVEAHYYSNGLKCLFKGDTQRPLWLPKFETVQLSSKVSFKDSEAYVASYSRQLIDGQIISWIGIYTDGYDDQMPGRQGGYCGIGMWLVDYLITDFAQLLGIIKNSAISLRNSTSKQDVVDNLFQSSSRLKSSFMSSEHYEPISKFLLPFPTDYFSTRKIICEVNDWADISSWLSYINFGSEKKIIQLFDTNPSNLLFIPKNVSVAVAVNNLSQRLPSLDIVGSLVENMIDININSVKLSELQEVSNQKLNFLENQVSEKTTENRILNQKLIDSEAKLIQYELHTLPGNTPTTPDHFSIAKQPYADSNNTNQIPYSIAAYEISSRIESFITNELGKTKNEITGLLADLHKSISSIKHNNTTPLNADLVHKLNEILQLLNNNKINPNQEHNSIVLQSQNTKKSNYLLRLIKFRFLIPAMLFMLIAIFIFLYFGIF